MTNSNIPNSSEEPRAILEAITHPETPEKASHDFYKTLPSRDYQAVLPKPSPERLKTSLTETAFDLNEVNEPRDLRNSHPATVLYLAYGSNLCNETFRGRRKISPISAMNVLVPSLVLTFDLPGMPYIEPCFANTRYRSGDYSSSTANPEGSLETSDTIGVPSKNDERSSLLTPETATLSSATRWKKPMVGVVYEVTTSDFAHIIATEGGGSGYQDVLVSCHPFAPGTSQSDVVPTEPQTPAFKAHTLFAPKGSLSRSDPDYAQASARYLGLIKAGAAEHSLPHEYTAYLSDLQPYTITTWRQRLGKYVFKMLWWPVLMGVFSLNRMFADKRGRSPTWLRRLQNAVFVGVWVSYDAVFHRLFGDGEKTETEKAQKISDKESRGAPRTIS